MKFFLRIGLIAGCFAAVFSIETSAQDSTSMLDKVNSAPDKLIGQVDKKARKLNERLVKQTDKYISSLRRHEEELRKKVTAVDSAAANRIFDDAKATYDALQGKMSSVGSKVSRFSGTYLPHLDSLKTAFNFFGNSSDLLKSKPELEAKLQGAMESMGLLQNRFAEAEEVKRVLTQRQAFLKEQLGKYNLSKQLKLYQKQVYYYQQQVTDYKQLLKDPSRLESKALSILSQSSKFKDFFSRNSELAALFRVPGSRTLPEGSLVRLAGLQTRESVMKDMLERFGSEGKIQEVLHAQAHDARAQLNQLKEKVSKMGGNGSEEPMPDFKPNGQKTKSFLHRLELGTNLQNVKGNGFLPATTDLGLSVGYKINDKSIVGLGGSYRMGWSKDFKHLTVTHQGVGVRSFVDYKLRGSIWLSGGAEMNYRSQFRSFEILDDYSAWQKSALLGVSKRYRVGKKMKGNMQLLYDFLWKNQVLRTQPVIFRFGYTLK
ncbi:MAG: hypothetical protein ABI151_08070 [Chitinophagaceae bacterium]